MASMTCICGQTSSLNESPNRRQFNLFLMDRFDKAIGKIISANKAEPDPAKPFFIKLHEILREPPNLWIFECPNCGRLLVFDKNEPFQPPVLSFLPERREDLKVRALRDFYPPAD